MVEETKAATETAAVMIDTTQAAAEEAPAQTEAERLAEIKRQMKA